MITQCVSCGVVYNGLKENEDGCSEHVGYDIQKKCKTCGKMYVVKYQEDLLLFFYKKESWLRNECKECECQKHADKYREGKYNYRKRDNEKYYMNYTFECF